MTKHPVDCPFQKSCEYGEAPPICKNCKRNRLANSKQKKYDTYQLKR